MGHGLQPLRDATSCNLVGFGIDIGSQDLLPTSGRMRSTPNPRHTITPRPKSEEELLLALMFHASGAASRLRGWGLDRFYMPERNILARAQAPDPEFEGD